MDQHSLERAVGAAGIEAAPVYRDDTPSTNDEAKELAERGAPEWTVVAAGHQTAGRGRLGRSWVERPGSSLLFSVILRPALAPERAPLISLLAAAVMARSCREVAGVRVACKWPNDLVVGERKLGGLLAEAKVAGGSVEHLVVGMGINLTMRPEDFPTEIRGSATSLAIEGSAPDAALLLERFLGGLRALYRPDHAGFAQEVLQSYRHVCETLGRRVRARTTGGQGVEGVAVDVDERGSLIVDAAAGPALVGFGEVEHLDGVTATETSS